MTDCFRQSIIIRIDGSDVARVDAKDPIGGMLMTCIHSAIADATFDVLDHVLNDYHMEDDGNIITLDFTTNL